MPQLNIVSYFSQTFWLFIFFGGFYLLVFYYFLVPFLVILKTRIYLVSKLFETENFIFVKIQQLSVLTQKTTKIVNFFVFLHHANLNNCAKFFYKFGFFYNFFFSTILENSNTKISFFDTKKNYLFFSITFLFYFFMKRFQSHPFHLVSYSFWPLFASLAAFIFTSGAILYMHDYINGLVSFFFGFVSIIFVMFLWWRDVVNEALLGHHTSIVQKGLKYGMLLFIVSEVMFFFGFFWAFFHSSLAPSIELGCVWPQKSIAVFHPLQIPLLNTLLLLLSGMSVTWSHHAMILNNPREANNGLLLTIFLATFFTLCQAYEYVEAGFTISDGAYGTTFYLTTGLHGLHVFIGTIFLFFCFLRHKKGHFLSNHHIGYLSAIWYWHFVDVVWLFLYLFVYCWGGYSSVLFL